MSNATTPFRVSRWALGGRRARKLPPVFFATLEEAEAFCVAHTDEMLSLEGKRASGRWTNKSQFWGR